MCVHDYLPVELWSFDFSATEVPCRREEHSLERYETPPLCLLEVFAFDHSVVAPYVVLENCLNQDDLSS